MGIRGSRGKGGGGGLGEASPPTPRTPPTSGRQGLRDRRATSEQIGRPSCGTQRARPTCHLGNFEELAKEGARGGLEKERR